MGCLSFIVQQMTRILVFTFFAIGSLTVPKLVGTSIDVAAFLRDANIVAFYALNPSQSYRIDEHGNWTEEEKKKEGLHGYKVLGKIETPQGNTLATIRGAFLAALENPDDPYLCFDPRHAVCLKTEDRHVDLLICFECHTGYAMYWMDGVFERQSVLVGESGRNQLNALLDSHGIVRDIPRSKQAEQAAADNPDSAP